MKSSSSRILRFLELKLSHGTGALSREPWDLGAILETAIGNAFYHRTVREGAKRVVRIRHGAFFEVGNVKYAALLFVLADSDYIDASYENIVTGEARTFAKEEGEGYRTEAHFIVRLDYEIRGATQVYAAALEESPGLGPSTILSRLQMPMHRAGQREGTNSARDTIKWYPLVELDGLFSKSLLDEIEKGELESFDLVRENIESGGLDEPGKLVRKRQTLHLDVREHPEAGTVSNVIARARQIAFEEQYEKVRIHYKEAGTSRIKSAVLDISQDAPDPAEPIQNLVSRTCKVELTEAMHYDHSEVVKGFVDLMAKTLETERAGDG